MNKNCKTHLTLHEKMIVDARVMMYFKKHLTELLDVSAMDKLYCVEIDR